MKRLLCAALAAFVVCTPVVIQGQGVIQTFFAVGPQTGEPTYNSFLNGMIAGMRGNTSLSTPLIPIGSTIPAGDIVSYTDKTGWKLFAGFSHINNTPFVLGQMTRVFSVPPSFVSSNTISGLKFGSALVGVKWGPDGPGTADIVYTSGEADSTPVNEIYLISNTYTILASDPSDKQRVIESYGVLHGNLVRIDASYSMGPLYGSGYVNLYVPEPSSFTLIGVGLVVLTSCRRRQ